MAKIRILNGYRSAATNDEYVARGLYDLETFPYPRIFPMLAARNELVVGYTYQLEFIRFYYDHYTQKQLKSMLSGVGVEEYQIQRPDVDYVSKMDYVLALKKRYEDIEKRSMD